MRTVNSGRYFALIVRDDNKPDGFQYGSEQKQSPGGDITWNENVCQQDVESIENLFTINPYDSNKRCFYYSGRMVQLMNKGQALFSISTSTTPFAFLDFGQESVPVDFFSGVVLGKGAYSYLTVNGSQNIIFSFVPVQKSKSRLEWEFNQEKGKKIKEEEAEIAQAKIKQDWENNPTYTDPDTGLMWTTSGGMGEPDRYLKDKAPMFWYDAVKWIKNLNYSGYSDWRLPTKDELVAFAKRGGYFPSEWLNKNGFHHVEPSDYWTSTPASNRGNPNIDRNTTIYVLDMFDGSLTNKDQGSSSYLWPVRNTNK